MTRLEETNRRTSEAEREHQAAWQSLSNSASTLDACNNAIIVTKSWAQNERIGIDKRATSGAEGKRTVKKAYQQPGGQHERVFETMALAFGIVQTTQAQCAHNRKAS
jgi:hypothetical protein